MILKYLKYYDQLKSELKKIIDSCSSKDLKIYQKKLMILEKEITLFMLKHANEIMKKIKI